MPVPLHIDNTRIAHQAAGRATRLASLLLAAKSAGEPLSVSTHLAGGPAALGAVCTPENPLGQWLRQQAGAPAVAQVDRVAAEKGAAPAPRTILSPIADIYRGLRTEGGPQDKLRTSDEQLESANPAEAGKSSAVAKLGLNDAASSRESDLLLLTAGVVRYCFGEEARGVDGQFDATVFSHLNGAADIIAPGARLRDMSSEQVQAIVTTAIQGSNSEFLKQLRSQAGVPPALAQATANEAPRGQAAQQFMKDGRFDADTFRSKTQAGAIDAMRMLASSPATIKVGLLAVAAQKAAALVEELPERQRSLSGLTQRIGDSLRARAAQRDEQNMAERPTASRMTQGV